MVVVEFISADWCKRCHALRPEVIALCKAAGATFTYVDYEELEEDAPLKKSIEALPTIRMKLTVEGPWAMWPAASFDNWKDTLLRSVVIGPTTTDF